MLEAARRRRGLVDLLVARRRRRGAHVDRGADLLELEVVGGGAVLDDVEHVLGVAGVADTLYPGALIGANETLSGPRAPVHRSFVLRVYRDILPTGTGGSSARKEPGRLVPGQITKVVAASDPYSAGYTRTLF